MENVWLKNKVREELEVEYKQKLDEVVAHCNKRLEAGFEEAWKTVQEIKAELAKERERNDNMEVKMYEEYEGKLKQHKRFLVDAIDRYMASPEYKHGLTAEQIIQEAIKK